ncbi:MAG TPA: HEAT repeat domain-containing protein [Candidatus Limnocylindrales bacterium]|nr:HEAT repeat domain-containing protein [Candidatus Limnocylindrales bacterium]
MTPAERNNLCEQVAPLLVFYACGELDSGEQTFVQEHLAACAACSAQLAEEKNLQALFASLPQEADRMDSAGVLLSQCRSELAETLDDLVRPPVLEKTPVFGAFRRWMALRPAWSGVVLVALGLLLGAQASQWYFARNAVNPLDDAVNVRPGLHFTDDQLSRMAVAGINFSPSTADPGAQNVRVELNAEQPVEINGSLDNTDVRRVVTYVVKSGDRFDPGLRLDCLEILKTRSGDSDVREALLSAARKDQNPAVRLKALEALRDSASEDAVRAVLLDTLKHDSNPGVRVEAVNLLVNSLDKSGNEENGMPAMVPGMPVVSDGSMVPAMANGTAHEVSMTGVIRTLEDLRHSDPSSYVRLRSAAALRQLSARGDQ